MNVWPYSIKPLVNYNNAPKENVRRTPSESGKTQIRDLWAGETKFQAECEFNVSEADGRTLIAFWTANRGEVVYFFDYDTSLLYTTENIGTGTGAALNFTIPAVSTASQLVYVNGVLKTAGVHYNITAASGANGEDRVIFTGGNAPANGHAVTITYTGSHLYEVDVLSFEWTIVSSMGRKRFRVRVEEAW